VLHQLAIPELIDEAIIASRKDIEPITVGRRTVIGANSTSPRYAPFVRDNPVAHRELDGWSANRK
jgi:hypothetical protein